MKLASPCCRRDKTFCLFYKSFQYERERYGLSRFCLFLPEKKMVFHIFSIHKTFFWTHSSCAMMCLGSFRGFIFSFTNLRASCCECIWQTRRKEIAIFGVFITVLVDTAYFLSWIIMLKRSCDNNFEFLLPL